MTISETAFCKIQKINSNGIGEASTSRGKVLLPYVLEGETVEFERHIYRGKESFKLKEILEPSSNRAAPKCEHYTSCGGCLLQHFSEESYINYQKNILKETLGIDVPIISIEKSKRRRVNLVFKKTDKKLLLGFYRYKSDNIANIESCVASEEQISNLIPLLRVLIEGLSIKNDSGEIFILKADNGLCINIKLESREVFDENHRRKLKSFANKHNIISLSYCHNKKELCRIINEISFVSYGNTNVEVEAESFLQATKESDNIISKIVLKYIGNDKTKRIADLFCGRGTITIPILEQGFIATGYENDKNALTSLLKCEIPNPKFEFRDLYHNPLKNELLNYDIVILNPPRTGAEEQVKNILNINCLEKIIYVSCSLASFKRDYNILKSHYEIKNIVAIDQFMWNPHIEIIAEFNKIRG